MYVCMYVCICYSAHSPLGLFSGRITFIQNWLFLRQLRFTSLSVFILTHPVNFPVGGNRSARRKPTTFGRVLTNSFRISGALGSGNIGNVLTENRTRNLRGERRALRPLRLRSPYLNITKVITSGTKNGNHFKIVYFLRCTMLFGMKRNCLPQIKCFAVNVGLIFQAWRLNARQRTIIGHN